MKVKIGTAYGKAFEFSGERVVFEDGKNDMKCTAFKEGEVVETIRFSSPHINVKIYSKQCNHQEIDDYDEKKHSGLTEE